LSYVGNFVNASYSLTYLFFKVNLFVAFFSHVCFSSELYKDTDRRSVKGGIV